MRVAGSVSGALLPRMFPASAGILVGGPVSPPEFLELVFELLSQIFDVVWWPVLNVHAEVQTHA